MKRVSYFLILLFSAFLNVQAGKHISIWPKGKMPDAQPQQIAAMTAEVNAKGFNPDKARMPYLEWRSYGVNLPSSLAVIHSSTSGYSPHPPVSVYGTGRHALHDRQLFLQV